MADPVSVIAGLVGVGQTVLLIVESLEGISESVDNAHDDIKLLSFELEDVRLLTQYLLQKAREIESTNRAIAQRSYNSVQRSVEKLDSVVGRIRKALQDCGLHLHYRYGRRQTFTSAWRKYKWHRKRPLLRDLRQELQGVKIDLNIILQMLSSEARRRRSSIGGSQAACEDQRSDSQPQQSEAHFKHCQQQSSPKQQRPPRRQDQSQSTDTPPDGHKPHRTREDIAAVFDSFSSFEHPSEPYSEATPGIVVECLKILLSLFPWPPPEWDFLELSGPDIDTLRQLNFTDQTTIARLSCHIDASALYHEANLRLLKCRKHTECGKSGLLNWVRKQYRWHVSEKRLRNGHPGIRMGEFDYSPIEDAIRCGIEWQKAIQMHVDSHRGPSATVLQQLWTYLIKDGRVA